jgi:hypothetical protein
MPLYKKLIFFGLGIALGSLMVAFLFGNREIQCSYFPNDRVLHDFRKKTLNVADAAKSQASQMGLDSSHFEDMLRTGIVNFKRSDPRQEPCGQYLMEWAGWKGGLLEVVLENCDSTLHVIDFSLKSNESTNPKAY